MAVAKNQVELPWPLAFIWAFFLSTLLARGVTSGRAYGVFWRVLQLAVVGFVVWIPVYFWTTDQPNTPRNLALDLGVTLGILSGFWHALNQPNRIPAHKAQPFSRLDYAITLYFYLAFTYAELRAVTAAKAEFPNIFLRHIVLFAVAQLTIGFLYRFLSFVLRKDYAVSRDAHYALLALPMALSLVMYAITTTWPVAVPLNLILLYLSWRLTDKRPQSGLGTLLDVWHSLRSPPAESQATE